MSVTTISSYVQKTVMPGYNGYGGTIVITSTGTLAGPSGATPGPALLANVQFSLSDLVINDGLVRGGNGGATGASAADLTFFGSFVNEGTVIGGTGSLGGGDGIVLSLGPLINTGSIYDRGTGVYTSDIWNSGSIGGGSIGVQTHGSIYTSGTISGGVDAIYSSGNYHLGLTIGAGAVFNGAVFDESGNGTMVLAGTTAGELNMGSSFIGFNNISFAPGSGWTLEGSGFELALGQKIAGFGPGDTIVLDSFAATSESFVPGIGLVLSNGTETSTLHVARPLPGNSFAVTNNGSSTTIATTGTNTSPISIISTLYANVVTPGVANYAASLTITSTGAVKSQGSIGVYMPSSVTGARIFNAGEITSTGNTAHSGTGIFGIYPVTMSSTDSGAYVENSGTIKGQNGVILHGGTIVNSGEILGNSTRKTSTGNVHYGYGINFAKVVDNTGIVYGGQVGVDLNGGGTLINSGTIVASQYGSAVEIGGPAHLIILPGAKFIGSVEGGISGSGSVIDLAGSGAGTLDMGTSFTDFTSIHFAPHVDWTLEGSTAELAQGQSITGFTLGDTIVLDGFAATSKIYAGGSELLLINNTAVVTLGITGSFSTGDFLVTDNAQGGTDISVLCYLRGTRLMTTDGERRVEELTIGDALPTRFGGIRPVKWIGRQSFAPAFAGRHKTPVRIAAGALGDNLPQRDLFVSPGHSVLLQDRLILARNLVNGVSITQHPAGADIDYFLVEFETHDCVLAEGVWAESYADGPSLRAQFHNAAEFYALYPGYITPAALALCAPRPEHGPALADALAPVLGRVAAHVPSGALRGHIEICGPELVEGWAQDEAYPEFPVTLMIFEGGTLRGLALACDYRADLAAAGLGSGHCFFRFTLAQPAQHPVRVFRASDGAEILATKHCQHAA